MGNQLLRELLEVFEDSLAASKALSPRTSVAFPNAPNKIKVAIGIRRSGKTSLLMQTICQLIASGTAMSQILYINFEDDRLQPIDNQGVAALVDAFYALHPANHQQTCYIFFDEIQNVENWALYIRRLNDTKNVQIYLTGSSAKLLSKEIATSLRGRSIAIEVWPFSFEEYLLYHKKPHPKLPMTTKEKDAYRVVLNEYIRVGGFPEVIAMSEEDRARILRDQVSVVLVRDIIERYHITNTAMMRYMIQTLLKNNAAMLSANKLYNTLKSDGFHVGRETIYDYLAYIEDAYLVFMVPLYSESVRKIHSNPKKCYAIDTGLVCTATFSFSQNHGHMFENIVYLDLRRSGSEVYYYLTRERYEVDFLVRNLRGEVKLYQVAWDMSDPSTLAREERALHAAQAELGCDGMIVTPENYLTFLGDHIVQ